MEKGKTMRETFEEAYENFVDVMSNFSYFAKTIAQSLIWFTTLFWVIPYAIIKKIKREDNGKA